MKKGFIQRHLPRLIYNGIQDATEIFNVPITPITHKGNIGSEKFSINPSSNNAPSQPDSSELNVQNNKS